MVRQATLNWTGPGNMSGQTATFFDDATTGAAIGLTLQAFIDALKPALGNGVIVTAAPAIRDVVTASGVLTGEEPLPTPPTANGTGGTSVVPNASMGLVRFATGVFVNGRQLKGRIYVPGMAASTMLGTGEVNTTGLNALNAAGAALRAGGSYVVWHRPVNGAGGAAHPAASHSAWVEFAVQRRRRG